MEQPTFRTPAPTRALLAVAAVAATLSVAFFIDYLAVGYQAAAQLAAKLQPIVVAAKR